MPTPPPPRTATSVEGDPLVAVSVEDARFPIVRIEPSIPPSERVGAIGPLYHLKPLLEELRSLTATRCHLLGARHVAGGLHNTFRAGFMVPRQDVEPVVAGLRALLERGDEEPLRAYLRWPPQLREPQPMVWATRV